MATFDPPDDTGNCSQSMSFQTEDDNDDNQHNEISPSINDQEVEDYGLFNDNSNTHNKNNEQFLNDLNPEKQKELDDFFNQNQQFAGNYSVCDMKGDCTIGRQTGVHMEIGFYAPKPTNMNVDNDSNDETAKNNNNKDENEDDDDFDEDDDGDLDLHW